MGRIRPLRDDQGTAELIVCRSNGDPIQQPDGRQPGDQIAKEPPGRSLPAGTPRVFFPSGDLLRFVPDGLANRPGAVRVLLVLPHQGGVPERGSASEGEGGASRAVYSDGNDGPGPVTEGVLLCRGSHRVGRSSPRRGTPLHAFLRTGHRSGHLWGGCVCSGREVARSGSPVDIRRANSPGIRRSRRNPEES